MKIKLGARGEFRAKIKRGNAYGEGKRGVYVIVPWFTFVLVGKINRISKQHE